MNEQGPLAYGAALRAVAGCVATTAWLLAARRIRLPRDPGEFRLASPGRRQGHRQAILRSDGYGDLSPGVPGFEVAYGLGYLGQRVGPADDRGDLAGLDQPAQCVEVGLAAPGSESTSARSCRPTPVHLAPSPPAMTSVPLGVSARRSRERRLFPPMSRIRS